MSLQKVLSCVVVTRNTAPFLSDLHLHELPNAYHK